MLQTDAALAARAHRRMLSSSAIFTSLQTAAGHAATIAAAQCNLCRIYHCRRTQIQAMHHVIWRPRTRPRQACQRPK